MLSMYAVEGTKLSFGIIRNAAYDTFVDVCCGDDICDSLKHTLVLPISL